MTKFILYILLTFFAINTIYSKDKLVDSLYKLEIEQKGFFNYYDKKGHTIGCDWNYECTGFDVVFYLVDIDRKRQTIHLQGRTWLSSHSWTDSLDRIRYGDTIGLGAVQIFLAKPFKRTLIKVPKTDFNSYYFSDTVRYSAKFPVREGDFDITIKVTPKDRLYFVGFNHRLKEYDIGKLLK